MTWERKVGRLLGVVWEWSIDPLLLSVQEHGPEEYPWAVVCEVTGKIIATGAANTLARAKNDALAAVLPIPTPEESHSS
ncbi:MAG TPA: hypothetical protein VGK74_02440 [Symbiobacteriaceae bacterium]|jgi:hypothetical protein